MDITPPKIITGVIDALYRAGGDDFATSEVETFALTFGGIAGDYHEGATRNSGGREPWYPRGTEIANERQISMLSRTELDKIAGRLGIPEIKPEWIGGNILIGGIDNLSFLPPRTILMFEGGATIRIDGNNAPCKVSGRAIAAHFEGREDIALGFPREAQNIRGLVGWVEKPGLLKKSEVFTARIPAQWIY